MTTTREFVYREEMFEKWAKINRPDLLLEKTATIGDYISTET